MINKGDPIIPKNLEELIKSKFTNIFSLVSNLVPIGFNSLYNITGLKTFNIRPKVSNEIYSSRSGSDISALTADTTQSNIGAAYLGTPWTANLADAFGVTLASNSNRGSYSEPYDKISPKVPYNPSTDLYGGVPLRGNSPLLFRGFVGLSNWFQDSNIRAFTDETGGTLTIKAKQLSMFYPYRESIASDDYTEYPYKKGISLSQPVPDVNLVVDSSGLAEGDYLVYVTGTGSYNDTTFVSGDLDVRFKDASALTTDYSVTWSGDEAGVAYGTGLRYERPLFIVHSNGTGIETSNVTAWDETIGTNTNTDYRYGKLYQQCTSTDTTSVLQTLENDRRMIPAYHYFNNNNDKLINIVSYNGLIRDIPGAGGNRVTIEAPVFSVIQPQMTIYVDQCELTNGTHSIWLKNKQFGPDDIYYAASGVDPAPYRGQYIWLTACITDATSETIGTTMSDVEGNRLQTKVILHSSPTWNPDNLNTGVAKQVGYWYKSDEVYRCRVGWIPSDVNNTSIETKIVDGKHIFPTINRFTGGANNSLPNLCIGTSGTAGTFKPVSLNTCRTLPVWGNRGITADANAITTATSVSCTSIDIDLYNVSGTRTVGSSWVGVTTDTIATAAGINIKATGAIDVRSGCPFLGAGSTGTSAYIYKSSYTMSIGTNDGLYYTGTGADGGSFWNRTFKMALVKGFYLPFSWR